MKGAQMAIGKLLFVCLLLVGTCLGQTSYFDGEYVINKGDTLTIVWDHPSAHQTIVSLGPVFRAENLSVMLLAPPLIPPTFINPRLLYFRVRSAPKVSGPFNVIATIWPVPVNVYQDGQYKWIWTADTYRELFVTAWYEVEEGTTKKIVESPGSNHIKLKVRWP